MAWDRIWHWYLFSLYWNKQIGEEIGLSIWQDEFTEHGFIHTFTTVRSILGSFEHVFCPRTSKTTNDNYSILVVVDQFKKMAPLFPSSTGLQHIVELFFGEVRLIIFQNLFYLIEMSSRWAIFGGLWIGGLGPDLIIIVLTIPNPKVRHKVVHKSFVIGYDGLPKYMTNKDFVIPRAEISYNYVNRSIKKTLIQAAMCWNHHMCFI